MKTKINLIINTGLILFLFTVSGCNSSNKEKEADSKNYQILNGLKNDFPFEVSIIDQFNNPVANAIIHGGFDWSDYTVSTDINGIAILPEYAKGNYSVIYKNNHIPILDSNTSSGQYILNKTSKHLDSIGRVEGKVIRFDKTEILSLDYLGIYRVYNYSENNVVNIFTEQLGDSVVAIKYFKLYSDTLWIATHSSGIYVFLISNILSPSLLYHFNIEGTVGPFYVRDSLLTVSYPSFSPGLVRVLVYKNNNEYYELSRLETDVISSQREANPFLVKNNSLVMLGLEFLPSIYDITNPGSYQLMFKKNNSNYERGFFYNDYIILIPERYERKIFSPIPYNIIDLEEKSDPVYSYSFNSNIVIEGITSDTSAYGWYTGDIFSVAEGSIRSSFSTVATVTRKDYQGVEEIIGGVSPPYYIYKSGLWILRNNE